MSRIIHQSASIQRDTEAAALTYVRDIDISNMTIDDIEVIYRPDATISEIRFYNPDKFVEVSEVKYTDPDDDTSKLTVSVEYHEYTALYLQHVSSSQFDQDWLTNELIPAIGNNGGLQFYVQ